MNAKLLTGTLMVGLLFFGCKKDKYGDKPLLTLKSVNTTTVPRNSVLEFTFELTRNGYVDTDSMLIIKTVSNCPQGNFQVYYPMPAGVPSTQNFKAEVKVDFINSGVSLGTIPSVGDPQCQLPGGVGANDSATFRFVIGQGKNISDTVTAGPIVIVHG